MDKKIVFIALIPFLISYMVNGIHIYSSDKNKGDYMLLVYYATIMWGIIMFVAKID